MSGPLSDERVQEVWRQQERRFSDIEGADLLELLSSEWGRRLYYRFTFLLSGLEAPSYAASGQYMAFLEGRRDIGITLKNEAMALYPELWVQMIRERAEQVALDNAQLREARRRAEERP